MTVIGYLRVSTSEQGDSGAGISAQRAAIEAHAHRQGWGPVCMVEEVASAKNVSGRPGLSEVLDALRRGEASTLVCSKVDRLSRSTKDFTSLMETAQREGWALVALDLGLDLSTPMGEAMAAMVATFSQLERRLIAQRTREALAARRAAGVVLGRPRVLSEALRTRIRELREEGHTLAAIANTLTAENVPTAQGGQRWYPGTVAKILKAAA